MSSSKRYFAGVPVPAGQDGHDIPQNQLLAPNALDPRPALPNETVAMAPQGMAPQQDQGQGSNGSVQVSAEQWTISTLNAQEIGDVNNIGQL
ncbi:hypothetical protein BG011_009366 [Mortierella polycephala]|uniref:Uncharacterized protein n=1 Tax=Mortierella polycephala TaxID=41804 RepID=A0A9P6Q8N6_9FUNG|nr:hypothetical protein BG011_009366 [Mortierella polycephala]